ncbi:MAG: hypothetical protein Tsb005_17410 [Gammaproteobacteria bacterium]
MLDPLFTYILERERFDPSGDQYSTDSLLKYAKAEPESQVMRQTHEDARRTLPNIKVADKPCALRVDGKIIYRDPLLDAQLQDFSLESNDTLTFEREQEFYIRLSQYFQIVIQKYYGIAIDNNLSEWLLYLLRQQVFGCDAGLLKTYFLGVTEEILCEIDETRQINIEIDPETQNLRVTAQFHFARTTSFENDQRDTTFSGSEVTLKDREYSITTQMDLQINKNQEQLQPAFTMHTTMAAYTPRAEQKLRDFAEQAGLGINARENSANQAYPQIDLDNSVSFAFWQSIMHALQQMLHAISAALKATTSTTHSFFAKKPKFEDKNLEIVPPGDPRITIRPAS